jgi:MFS family permease
MAGMLKPKEHLSGKEINSGLKLIIADGIASEVIIAFGGGAFLIALALYLGASNFQIGLLAALPTVTNLFQLISVWLVRKWQNRRLVTVVNSFLARVPLLFIGLLPFLDLHDAAMKLLLLLIFFHYLFSSIAGPSWNAWMKDLVPEESLGAYFSRRNTYTQSFNVILSIAAAVTINLIERQSSADLGPTYGALFLIAGIAGLAGVAVLARVPEPRFTMSDERIFSLIRKPLCDTNFRRLLFFNCAWTFAINIATPFFTVFMMKTLGFSISYVIGLTIASQLASIITVRGWGSYADRYSNKTIIAISAPLYILTLLVWCYIALSGHRYVDIVLLIVIHVLTGIANAGINLSITNLGLKLAPKDDAIVFLSVRNMALSVFSSIAPILGGFLADYFRDKKLNINLEWMAPGRSKELYLIALHDWNFLFLIGAFLSLLALQLLVSVNEVGEVEKDEVIKIMRSRIRTNLRDFFIIGTLIGWHEELWELIRRKISIR